MNRRSSMRIVLLTGVVMLLSGCYLMKQGFYLLKFSGKGVDNARLLNAPDTPESTREFLELVEDISRFAVTELGLETNRNYTRFAEIDRDYLAWVVSGTDEFSFDPYEWKYPLVGRLPYKGFYVRDDAMKEAQRLEGEGYDVWIRRVDAFSTLGYLTDPLYSYMKDYSVYHIANLIIHEQVHATIFLKGQGEFNEGFATFVGDAGAKLYIAERYGTESGEMNSIILEEHDRAVFLNKLQELKARLEAAYLAGTEETDLQGEKEAILAAFAVDFRERYERDFMTDLYRRIPDISINNAFISLYSLYNDGTGIFEEIYQNLGNDLPETIRAVITSATISGNALEDITFLAEPNI